MLKKLLSKFSKCDKKHVNEKEQKEHKVNILTDPVFTNLMSNTSAMDAAIAKTFQVDPIAVPVNDDGSTMDARVEEGQPFSLKIQSQQDSVLPPGQLGWYASFGFIG